MNWLLENWQWVVGLLLLWRIGDRLSKMHAGLMEMGAHLAVAEAMSKASVHLGLSNRWLLTRDDKTLIEKTKPRGEMGAAVDLVEIEQYRALTAFLDERRARSDDGEDADA